MVFPPSNSFSGTPGPSPQPRPHQREPGRSRADRQRERRKRFRLPKSALYVVDKDIKHGIQTSPLSVLFWDSFLRG